MYLSIGVHDCLKLVSNKCDLRNKYTKPGPNWNPVKLKKLNSLPNITTVFSKFNIDKYFLFSLLINFL